MNQPALPTAKTNRHPFRRAVFRGLGVVLPPLLTIAIFFWAAQTIHLYVLEPVTQGARNLIVWRVADIRTELPGAVPAPDDPKALVWEGQRWVLLSSGEYVPQHVYTTVRRDLSVRNQPTTTGNAVYNRWVEVTYLRPYIVVPVFLVVCILLMYLVGRFLAAGIGRVLWNLAERAVDRVPLVRNVYSSVKQVTDFMISEREMEFTRVVAIEYPRKGIYSIAFVTGEGMRDVSGKATEPVISVLVPTSPMPMTGYTMMIRKSETIDLDLTVDQALQFIISCGVVVPPHQLRGRFKTVA